MIGRKDGQFSNNDSATCCTNLRHFSSGTLCPMNQNQPITQIVKEEKLLITFFKTLTGSHKEYKDDLKESALEECTKFNVIF